MNTKAHRSGLLWVAVAVAATWLLASAPANASVASQREPSQQDTMWLKEIHQFSLSAIKRGQLAEKKAGSPPLRRMARTLVAHHRQMDSQVRHVAHDLNIALPHHMLPNEKFELGELAKKSGAAFDRAWMSDEIHAHEGNAHKTHFELYHGFSKKVEGLAKRLLPVIRKHLRRLETLSGKTAG